MKNSSEKYAAAYGGLRGRRASDFQIHFEKYGQAEKHLPKGLTFLFLKKASTKEYLFFSENVKECTGFSQEELYVGGVTFVLDRVPSEDRELKTEAISLLTAELYKLRPKQILRSNLQYNYRFEHKTGDIINIFENLIPIALNEEGLPFLFLGHAWVVRSPEKLPVNASLSILQDNNEYKTHYSVNVNRQFLLQLLTKREKEIYDLMVLGYSNKVIAKKCSISVNTVMTHRKRVNAKLKKLKWIQKI